MRRFGQRTLLLAVFVIAAAPVLAQRGGGGRGGPGGGSMGLLMNKDVQQDLKMTDEQIAKVNELMQKQREAMKDLSPEEKREKMPDMAKANERQVSQILKPEQRQRLKQLRLQRDGAMAIADPEVASNLQLSGEQREKIKSITDDMRKEFGELRQSGAPPEEMRQKMGELRKSTNDKIMEVLTEEQKAKWKEMQGAPFKGDFRPAGPRRGGTKKDDK